MTAGADTRGSAGGSGRPEAIKAIPIRHWGRWIASVVILFAAFALVFSFVRNPNVQWPVIRDYLFSGLVVRGSIVTLELTFIAMVIGGIGGTILAVMRLSRNYVLSSVSWVYIWFFRGTPVYVQILLWNSIAILYPRLFLGLPFVGVVFASVDSNTLISVFVAST